MHTYIMISIV